MLIFRLFLVVHQHCDAEKQTLIPASQPVSFERIGTRSGCNIHKMFACKYLSNDICTVVEEWTHGYFYLGYFSSSTHFDTLRPRYPVSSESVAAVFSVFCARSWLSWRKLQRSPCEHWHFSFTSNRNLFLLQRRSTPCVSLPLLVIQFSHALRRSFKIGISDLHSSSPWFSTFDNWDQISSDESPCRTSPIRFLSCANTRILNLYRLSKLTSSDGIFDINKRTSPHLVSNFLNAVIMKSNREQIGKYNTVSWAPISRKQSYRRSWTRSVFLVETDPLCWALSFSKLTFLNASKNWRLAPVPQQARKWTRRPPHLNKSKRPDAELRNIKRQKKCIYTNGPKFFVIAILSFFCMNITTNSRFPERAASCNSGSNFETNLRLGPEDLMKHPVSREDCNSNFYCPTM